MVGSFTVCRIEPLRMRTWRNRVVPAFAVCNQRAVGCFHDAAPGLGTGRPGLIREGNSAQVMLQVGGHIPSLPCNFVHLRYTFNTTLGMATKPDSARGFLLTPANSSPKRFSCNTFKIEYNRPKRIKFWSYANLSWLH